MAAARGDGFGGHETGENNARGDFGFRPPILVAGRASLSSMSQWNVKEFGTLDRDPRMVQFGLPRLLVPSTNFQSGPQFSSSPADSDTWVSQLKNNSNNFGFSCDMMNCQDSASNVKRQASVLKSPSTSNTLPLQLETMRPNVTSNFYTKSDPQYTLLPSRDSSLDFFNNGHEGAEKTNNQEAIFQGWMSNVTCKANQSREYGTQKMIQIPRQPMIHHSLNETDDEFKDTELKLVIRKELSNSDVGTVGRIVLPKKEAETNLPRLLERDGIILQMEDFTLPVIWKFKYRFWPNNKSRMYVMETTGEFVKTHGLQTGDLFIIYRDAASGNYIVRGKRGNRPPKYMDVFQCTCKPQCIMNEDCYTDMLASEKECDYRHQISQEQNKILGRKSSLTTEDGIGSFRMDFLNNSGEEHDRYHHFSFPLSENDPDNISLQGVPP